jgi:hypothetical protein
VCDSSSQSSAIDGLSMLRASRDRWDDGRRRGIRSHARRALRWSAGSGNQALGLPDKARAMTWVEIPKPDGGVRKLGVPMWAA